MSQCDNCGGCGRLATIPLAGQATYLLVGNVNVGKSTVYTRLRQAGLTGGHGTSLETAAKAKGTRLTNVPGVYSLFSGNPDERGGRDPLLTGEEPQSPHRLLFVADAKNLKRSLAVALQYIEYGLPMVIAINMVDEAVSRGIEIDFAKLSHRLGLTVFPTIAREGLGISELIASLPLMAPAQGRLRYTSRIEQFLALVHKLLNPKAISSRALGLLLLTGDQGVDRYIEDNFGSGMLRQLHEAAELCRNDEPADIEIALANHYHREAALIAAEVQRIEAPSKNPWILRLGDWCTKTSTGIPIALVVLVMMYLFVGSFAATYLVDTINGVLFEGILIPWATRLANLIPNPLLRDLIIDADFGILPSGLFLAMGLVLPVIFCFYVAFGILEDSGYLPRISLLLDRLFRTMGLNGKGVIPLVMGFSCVTMALLTTRILSTEKEKNIACFLLFLCLPCAPLIAVMLVILDRMPLSARVTVFGLIFLQLLIAGFLANKVLPGDRSPLFLEIPTMRVPKPWAVLSMSAAKTYFFMKEAIPVFIYASIAVFFFQRIGGLGLLERALGPLLEEVMGLPEQSIQVFIKTMIRRESGAAELQHLSATYTNLQIVVNLLVMTFIAPCLNATIVLFKERGLRVGLSIMGAVTAYAILLGSLVNTTCRFFGVTFT